MEINITPAVQIEERKHLSTEEFQKQLCSWLESRGLLCELRAYFRSNMIEVLKNTALGSTISCKIKQPITPKMQAINLLISEYFIYSQYHFSLCVFCTEVSLNHMLSDIANTSVVSKSEEKFKFSEKEVYEILEAVGLLRHNRQAQKIFTSYCELDQPLISYFLPSGSITNIPSNEQIESIEPQDLDYEIVNNNIDRIISNTNMPLNEVSELKYYIKLLCNKENEKQTKLVDDLKEQYKNQLKKYKSKLHEIQQSFENERKQFQEEINIMNRELSKVLLHNKTLKNDEKYLDLPEVANLIQELRHIEAPSSKENIPVAVENKAVQYDADKQKKQLVDQEQQTMTNASLESAVLKHVVQQLEKENSNLRCDNFNYCEQIDELANRASILMSELNISQQNIIRLNNLLQNTPTIFSSSRQNDRHQVHYTGAGEQGLETFNAPATRNYRHISGGYKKHACRKKIPNVGTSSGSTSPTDEVLQEAKKKLKSLEIESDNIDRKILNATQRFCSFPNKMQNKYESNTNREGIFKFNTETSDVRNRIFEFGAAVRAQNKESTTDTEYTSSGSRVTLTTDSISLSQFDDLQVGNED